MVHVSTSHRGGAGIAAYRLFKAQRAQRMPVAFLSKTLSIDFHGNELRDHDLSYKRPSLLARLSRKLNRLFHPSTRTKMMSEFERIQNDLICEETNLPFSPHHLAHHPLLQEADVVHLHWVAGLIDYSTFFRRCSLPILWTLHDMHPFMGLFHYENDQARNRPLSQALDDKVLHIKATAYQEIHRMTVTAPSQWMLDKAISSEVFPEKTRFHCIPNSVDLDRFRPMPLEATRNQLGILESSPMLLYIAGNVTIERKGHRLLVEALEQHDQAITLIAVGSGQLEVSNPLVSVCSTGFLDGEEELAMYYNAADVVLLSSTEDNLPNTMLEAMACGTPVLAFDNGGMREHLPEPCIMGKPSVANLAEALRQVDKIINLNLGDQLRQQAEQTFGADGQMASYQALYRDVMD